MRSLLAVLLLACVGCLAVPAHTAMPGRMGALMPSPARVASCRSTEHAHDAWSLTATLAGAVGGGAGGIAGFVVGQGTTASDERLGLGLGAAVMGVLGALGSALASIESSAFAAQGCAEVLSNATEGP